MKPSILAVVLLMACGAPVAAECDEGAVDCESRCINVCEHGQRVAIRCLRCEESVTLVQCSIPRLPVCATENQR